MNAAEAYRPHDAPLASAAGSIAAEAPPLELGSPSASADAKGGATQRDDVLTAAHAPRRSRLAPVAAALAAILLIAAALRLIGLGSKSLWLDEAMSWRLQRFSLALLWERTQEPTSVHPPLYFALLHGWVLLFGDSEFSLRMPAALAGLGQCVAIYALLIELINHWGDSTGSSGARGSGRLAALLVACSPLQIFLSQQARGYALAGLMLLLSCWLLLRALRGPGQATRYWAAYSISALTFCYLHHLALFSIAAQWLFAAVYLARTELWPLRQARAADGAAPARRNSRRWPAAMVVFALVGLAYLPALLRLPSQSDKISNSWSRTIALHDLPEEVFAALLNTSSERTVTSGPLTYGALAALLVMLLLLMRAHTWAGFHLMLLGLLPALGLIVYSVFSTRSIFDARYLCFSQLPWLAGFAYAVSRLRLVHERVLVAALLLLWSCDGCYYCWRTIGPSHQPGLREAMHELTANRLTGEPVIVQTPFVFYGASYYLRHYDPPRLCVTTADRALCFGTSHLLDEDLITPGALLTRDPASLWIVTSDSYNRSSEVYLPLQDYLEIDTYSFDQDVSWERPVHLRHYMKRNALSSKSRS